MKNTVDFFMECTPEQKKVLAALQLVPSANITRLRNILSPHMATAYLRGNLPTDLKLLSRAGLVHIYNDIPVTFSVQFTPSQQLALGKQTFFQEVYRTLAAKNEQEIVSSRYFMPQNLISSCGQLLLGAFLTGDDALFQRWSKMLDYSSHMLHAAINSACETFFRRDDGTPLRLTGALAPDLYRFAIQRAIWRGAPLPFVEIDLSAAPLNDRVWLHIWRGDRAALLNDMTHIQDPAAEFAEAGIALLDGNWSSADKYFCHAIGKSAKERNGAPLPAIALLTAILTASRNGTAITRIRNWIRDFRAMNLSGAESGSQYYAIYLAELSEMYRAPAPGHYRCEFPCGIAFTALLSILLYARAVGSQISAEDIQKFQACGRQFADAGWLLAAVWMNSAVAAMLPAEAPERKQAREYAERCGITPFLAPEERRDPWEAALDALAVAFPDNTAAHNGKAPAENGIVVWKLQLTDIKKNRHVLNGITPRLLSRRADGTLSRGRNIAIARFSEGEFDALLNDQERKLTDSRYRQVRWSDAPNSLAPEGIAELAGNPRVYPGDADTPVRIAPGKNGIELKPLPGGGYRLRPRYLRPPENKDDVLLIPDEEGIWRYVLPDETNNRINQFFQQFGTDKMTVEIPAAGTQRLAKTLSRLSRSIGLAGTLPEGLFAELPEFKAQIALRVRLRRCADALIFELRNRPAEESALVQIPGMGNSAAALEINGERVRLTRDLEAEKAAASRLIAACPALAVPQTAAMSWEFDDPGEMLEALAELQDTQTPLDWPEKEEFRISAPLTISQFRLTATSGTEWFSLGGQVPLNDGKVLEFARFMELFDTRKGNYIELDEKNYLRLTKRLVRQLELLRGAGRMRRDSLELPPAALPMLGNAFDGDDKALPQAIREQVKRVRDAMARTYPVPAGLRGQLRSYQREGYEYLRRMADCRIGCCLADDMGLGKTIELLALLLAESASGPALVVAPASVCRNWAEEAARFAPGLRVCVPDATNRDAVIAEAKPGDLVIASYGMLLAAEEQFASGDWHTVILDEAQAIKNHTAKRARAAKKLHADIRVAATGTPIENHLLELWSLFDFLNPGLLGGETEFNRRFGEEAGESGRQVLRKILAPLLLRRLKSEVLDDLPPKTEITLPVVLTDEERALYESLRRKALEDLADSGKKHGGDASAGVRRVSILAHLTKLRRICCHPSLAAPDLNLPGAKLELLRELAAELRANGHRALIFSQFVDFLRRTEQALIQDGCTVQYLDGATPLAQRMERVNAFQNGEGDFFCISLKAGGTGLNLTAADYVILTDPWWNPAVEEQAADRIYRIGQHNPVTVYRLVTSDTVEEKVIALHAVKRQLAEDVLSGGGGKFTESELLSLFS